MDTADEYLLDRFVREPETLSETERQKARRLAESSPAAAAYADHLRDFYALLDEEQGRETPSQVEAFVDGVFSETADEKEEKASPDQPAGDRPPATVEARPFSSRRGARPTVLAAATETTSDSDAGQRFQTYATLTASGGEVLVRVVGDRSTGRGRIYVLSGNPERRAHAVVSLPGLGLDLLTGETGTATFDLPNPENRIDWKEATALVRRPLATARLSPGETRSLQPAGSSASLQCRHEDGRLVARLPTGDGLAFLGVRFPDAPPRLLPLSEGPVTCSVPEDELTLRAYR
jgi:hypothetical protein